MQLYGLVLIGGKSNRMGSDKSLIDYHGKPQWQYAVEQLEGLVDKVFLSVRQRQSVVYPNLIRDKHEGKGPFGAIMTALESYPNTAFLVIATDLPNMAKQQFKQLIEHRDTTKIATAFQGKNKPYAEPLVAIWEASALEHFQDFAHQNNYKIQRVLQSKPFKKVIIDDHYIHNIITPDDYTFFKNENAKLP